MSDEVIPSKEDREALDELAKQAQELNMGYFNEEVIKKFKQQLAKHAQQLYMGFSFNEEVIKKFKQQLAKQAQE